ncbi:hypothetical protein IKE86_01010 [Candidatus Saccharibacteria bacterium]|nr:hypothetical protein [Candidatus Saccharibacteria bacterium]
MARKTLYDIIEENELKPTVAFARLRYYYERDIIIEDDWGYQQSFKKLVELYAFEILPIRNAGQINLSDLMKDIGLNNLSGEKSFDDVFLFIEFIMCCYDTLMSQVSFPYRHNSNSFKNLINCINGILSATNCKLVKTPKGKIVIQEDQTAEEVIKKVDESLGILLYKYKHYKNDLNDKKQILCNILSTLAPEIQTAKKNGTKNRLHDVANRIDDIANNFNVRHNNTVGKDKNDYASNLTDVEQEYWYDALYEAILLFILEKDYDKAKDKLQKLRNK